MKTSLFIILLALLLGAFDVYTITHLFTLRQPIEPRGSPVIVPMRGWEPEITAPIPDYKPLSTPKSPSVNCYHLLSGECLNGRD